MKPSVSFSSESVYDWIVQQSKNHRDQKVEISPTDLARLFSVQPQTIEYHIRKLIDQKRILALEETGKYNRKKYRINQSISTDFDFSSLFDIQSQISSLDIPVQPVVSDTDLFPETVLDSEPAKPLPSVSEDFFGESDILDSDVSQTSSVNKRIHDFMERFQSIESSETLVQKHDKEILSVLNETIQQHMVYMKDLTEQLSMVQNKQLIQTLIDERNEMIQQQHSLISQIEELQKQVQLLKPAQDKTKMNNLRVFQQMILNTVDNFIDSPNHQMAVSRNKFREQITKDLAELIALFR